VLVDDYLKELSELAQAAEIDIPALKRLARYGSDERSARAIRGEGMLQEDVVRFVEEVLGRPTSKAESKPLRYLVAFH
jgi:hypothetical protein